MDKQSMIDIYKKYGINMPLKAKYKRSENRIYFASNFQDSEEIYFHWNCGKTNACAVGNAFYVNKNGVSNLVNIKELILIN